MIRPRVSVIAIPICFSILWVMLGTRIVGDAKQHDFLNLYAGASLAWQGSFTELHDHNTQLRREQQLVPGTKELIPFVRPAFYALLISPLAAVPYNAAFWLWLGVQAALAAGCIWWGCKRFGLEAVFFASMFAPMALSIPHGQDAPLMLAILVGSYALAEKGRPEAGAVLSLGLIKFHLLVLWPVLLAVQKRWRMLAHFVGGAVVLAAASILLSGPRGLLLYRDLLSRRDLGHLLPSPEKNVNIMAVLANFRIDSTLLYGLLALATLCFAVIAVRRAPLWKLFAVATSGSILIVPHAYAYDLTMLLLPLWCGMFLSTRKLTRLASATLCLPVVFFLTLLGPPFSAALALLVMAFLLSAGTESPRCWEEH